MSFVRPSVSTAICRLAALAIAGVIAATAIAPAAHAQAAAAHFNIAAGAAIPVGDFGNLYDVGYNITAGLGFQPPGTQIGFRAEGTYSEFAVKNAGEKSHIGGVTGDVTFDVMPGARRNAPGAVYLLGGIGYYALSQPDFFESSQNGVGYNVGGGVRFPLSGFSAYVEARFFSMSPGNNSSDARYVPIVFGLVF